MKSRIFWGAAAVAVVVIALVAAMVGLGSNDDEPDAASDAQPTITESPSHEPSEDTSEEGRAEPTGEPAQTLAMPEEQTGRCMVPSADKVSTSPVAFDAVVTGINNAAGTVLLDVRHWYAAEGFSGSDTIIVKASPGGRLEGDFRFRQGQRYLIAASADAEVALCGFSGPKNTARTQLYQQAFA